MKKPICFMPISVSRLCAGFAYFGDDEPVDKCKACKWLEGHEEFEEVEQ